MAINMNRFIDIKSSAANAAVGSRELGGLVFSSDACNTGASFKADYDLGKPIKLTLDEVTSGFASTTDIYKFAVKYFGYISPSGNTPNSLTVVKMLSDEDCATALARIDGLTNNFGCFTFLGTQNSDDLAEAAAQNAGYDNKYLMVIGVTSDNASTVKTAVGEHNGLAYIQGDAYAAYMIMAVAAATDYEQINSSTVFMFKQFNGETPTVTTDSDATSLDTAHINYYGRTQTNGKTIDFLQRGVLSNGKDIACYCNEIWLKSAIATRIINLFTSVEKIPANGDGEAMIANVVAEVATDALRNGSILVGKTLDANQRSQVLALTNDRNAISRVETQGYWLGIYIEKDGEEYKCKYRLVYSKGDSIRKVDGVHNMI